MSIPMNLATNPTDEQRHEMLRVTLENQGRLEDYHNIIQLLSPPPDITNYAPLKSLKDTKIGIIGGGLAGLSAAYELKKLGADITIFDALEDRIGGKVYTHYFDQNKQFYGELGALRIPASHETTWHYINQLQLSTQPLISPNPNNFLYVHNTRIRNSPDNITQFLYPNFDLTAEEHATPWMTLNDYAFRYAFNQLSPQVRTEFLRIQPNYSPEYLFFVDMSIRQAMEALGLSQEAISLISGVRPTIGSLLNISYDEAIQEVYSLDFVHPYTISGGNVHLPLAFYQALLTDHPSQYYNIPANQLGQVSYRSSHYVTGIYQSNYRNKVILKYTNTKSFKDGAAVFDYIICAIPFSTLREVEIKPYFSNRKMQAILEYNYVDAHKTLFYSNRRFWERETEYGSMVGGISFTDLPIQSILYPSIPIIDHNHHIIAEEPGVLVASYSLGQNATRIGNLTDQRRYKRIQQNIEEVHGLPRGYITSYIEQAASVTWSSDPNFRGGLALGLPGQKRLFAYSMLLPEYNHRVFFAGDHVSAKHGWMQGALYTGKLAANMLAQSKMKV